jgi:hypothetical protein
MPAAAPVRGPEFDGDDARRDDLWCVTAAALGGAVVGSASGFLTSALVSFIGVTVCTCAGALSTAPVDVDGAVVVRALGRAAVKGASAGKAAFLYGGVVGGFFSAVVGGLAGYVAFTHRRDGSGATAEWPPRNHGPSGGAAGPAGPGPGGRRQRQPEGGRANGNALAAPAEGANVVYPSRSIARETIHASMAAGVWTSVIVGALVVAVRAPASLVAGSRIKIEPPSPPSPPSNTPWPPSSSPWSWPWLRFRGLVIGGMDKANLKGPAPAGPSRAGW